MMSACSDGALLQHFAELAVSELAGGKRTPGLGGFGEGPLEKGCSSVKTEKTKGFLAPAITTFTILTGPDTTLQDGGFGATRLGFMKSLLHWVRLRSPTYSDLQLVVLLVPSCANPPFLNLSDLRSPGFKPRIDQRLAKTCSCSAGKKTLWFSRYTFQIPSNILHESLSYYQ